MCRVSGQDPDSDLAWYRQQVGEEPDDGMLFVLLPMLSVVFFKLFVLIDFRFSSDCTTRHSRQR